MTVIDILNGIPFCSLPVPASDFSILMTISEINCLGDGTSEILLADQLELGEIITLQPRLLHPP